MTTVISVTVNIMVIVIIVIIIIIIQFFALLHFQLLTGRSAIETAQAAVKQRKIYMIK
jgi:hypothetical protein